MKQPTIKFSEVHLSEKGDRSHCFVTFALDCLPNFLHARIEHAGDKLPEQLLEAARQSITITAKKVFEELKQLNLNQPTVHDTTRLTAAEAKRDARRRKLMSRPKSA